MTTAFEHSTETAAEDLPLPPGVNALPDGEAFLAFLHDRLCEEVLAATHRRASGTGPAPEVAERGLRMLDELILDIKYGRPLDRVSMQLLALAYQKHPDFRPDWAAALASSPPR